MVRQQQPGRLLDNLAEVVVKIPGLQLGPKSQTSHLFFYAAGYQYTRHVCGVIAGGSRRGVVLPYFAAQLAVISPYFPAVP
jgi:hypothetical protein